MTTTDEDVLASPTRRRALAMLVAGEHVSFETLAARLAAGDGPAGTTARDYATRLHHVDLPRLAEAGYVVWNWAGGEVEATDAGRALVTDGPVERPTAGLVDGGAGGNADSDDDPGSDLNSEVGGEAYADD